MITLRQLAMSDRAIGCITSEECHMIAAVLDRASNSWWFRRRLPKEYRDKALPLRMIAAALGRTPSEREPSVQAQIRLNMEADRGR